MIKAGALPQLPTEIAIAPDWIQRRDALLAKSTAVAEIASQEQYDDAEVALKRITKGLTELEKMRKELGDPFLRAQREIKRVADDAAAPLEAEKQRLKVAMVAHVQAVEAANRRAFEENARKAEEAEAELARKQEAINPFDEPSPFDDLPVAPVVPEPVQEVQVHRAMSNVAKVWSFRIISGDAVPREYCQPDERIIRAAVAGGCREIAGVEIFEETKVASR
jgi:hypothetical protein